MNVVCKNCCEAAENLYVLPCRHVLCGDCINPYNRSEVVCGYCGQRYKKIYVAEYTPNQSTSSDSDEYYDEGETM